MATFKVGDKVRINPVHGIITYSAGEFDTVLQVKGDSVLLEYPKDLGQDWWGIDRLAPYEAPTGSIETPCVLEDKNARIAELEAQLNVMELDRDDWKQSCISANRRFEANDSAMKENFELKQQLTKAQADLVAAQTENARMKEAIEGVTEALQANIKDKDLATVWMQASWNSRLIKMLQSQAPSPSQEVTLPYVQKCPNCSNSSGFGIIAPYCPSCYGKRL